MASDLEVNIRKGPDPHSVFIVHGRNLKAKLAIENFLRSAGLQPIPWEQAVEGAVRKEGHAAPVISDVVEIGLANAQAVLVLATGDDMARIVNRYDKESLKPQPRANVIFEAGMAFGRFPDRTIFVEIGNNRAFSDIAGRIVVKLDGTPERSRELLNRLKGAGCKLENEQYTALPSLGSDLIEGDLQQNLEISKVRLYLGCALLLVLGIFVGVFGHRIHQSSRDGAVQVTGEINSPRTVSMYFVGPQLTKSHPGDIRDEISLRRRLSYKVLFVNEREILDEQEVEVDGNKIALKPYPKVELKEETSEEEARRFLSDQN